MLIDNMLELEAKYQKLLNEIENVLYNSPREHVRFSNGGYYSCEPGDPNGVYIAKGTPEGKNLLEKLCQKRYLKVLREVVEDDLNVLHFAMKKSTSSTLASVYDDLPEPIKEFVSPYELSNEEYARRWENASYKSGAYENIDASYITKKKDHVRSKSELIIANTLYDLGVPYKYEKRYKIMDYGDFAPDFTVLNKRTRQVYIWEHFGRIGAENYRSKAIKKIEMFTEFEVLTGIKFVSTFEDDTKPLSSQHIENFIRVNFL